MKMASRLLPAKGSRAPGRIRYLVAFAIVLVVMNVVFVDLPSVTGGRGYLAITNASFRRASSRSRRDEGTAITLLGSGAGARTTSSTTRTRQQEQPLNVGQEIYAEQPASSHEDDDSAKEASNFIRGQQHNTEMAAEQEERYAKGQQKQMTDLDLDASADDQNAFIALPEDSIDGGDTEGNVALAETDGSAGGDVEAKADEGQAPGQQSQSSWELLHHVHHGRDQSKFPFDRDEPADEGVLNHLVWPQHVPILLTKTCQFPESRLREDGMEYFSNVFIPEKPLAGKHGFPVGGCGRRVPESPGTGDGEVPKGMEKLTFRISGVAYRALPETDIPQRKAAKRWGSCAVVGNSGSLLASERGAEIDAHDMVLRMNNAPLSKAYQPHVGSRTTIALMNQHHGKLVADHERLRHNNAMVLLYESAHPHVRNQILVHLRARFRNSSLLSPAFLVRAFSTWFKLKSVVEEERMELSIERNTTYREMKRKPMSGFFAALFALQVCQRVDLYGFAPWTKGSAHKDNMPYHYFDRVSGVTEVHSFPLAFKVFKLMGQHANLTIAAS